MTRWLAARWQAFLGSFDPDEAVASSTPFSTVLAAGTLASLFLVVGLVPALRERAQFTALLPCILLAACGGALTYTAYRERCRGTVGALATLFDNGFYGAALALAAATSAGGFSIGFALLQGLMLVGFPASFYGFSLLMLLVLCLPTVALLAWHVPDVPVTLVLLGSCFITAYMMLNTQRRRQLLASTRRLEQALGATDEILDVAMQRALTTTLLNLGNFLHELRNVQTAVRMNLEFLEREGLSQDQVSAVNDALGAARSEQALLEETLDELRRQARPSVGQSFELRDVLERALRGRPSGLRVELAEGAPSFEVFGEPAHLATILRNLLRNARQAGAEKVRVELSLDGHARAALITVKDDGPGIPEPRLPHLFQAFMTDGKPNGTGLGLYLCRRYVELMHGEIRVDNEPGGGARFSIRLPGRVATVARAAETIVTNPVSSVAQ